MTNEKDGVALPYCSGKTKSVFKNRRISHQCDVFFESCYYSRSNHFSTMSYVKVKIEHQLFLVKMCNLLKDAEKQAATFMENKIAGCVEHERVS